MREGCSGTLTYSYTEQAEEDDEGDELFEHRIVASVADGEGKAESSASRVRKPYSKTNRRTLKPASDDEGEFFDLGAISSVDEESEPPPRPPPQFTKRGKSAGRKPNTAAKTHQKHSTGPFGNPG